MRGSPAFYHPEPLAKRRPPCRSVSELAEEFGVDMRVLGRMLHKNGPQPRLNRRDHGSRNNWYNAAEVRAWWKQEKSNE